MNTKSLSKRPSLSDEAISRFVDPRTGERLRPLGYVGGRAVWPMMGASPDDDSSEEHKEKTEDGKDGSEGGSSSEDKDKGNPESKIAALEDEKNRHVRRRQEAEAERERLQKELDELKGKDQSELEKANNRVTELESENKALQESLRQSRLENAFLSDNTFEWHNPGRALALADLSDVEIDSDGTVHGLKKALEALAKSDAYLLKSKESKEKDDEEDLVDTGDQQNKSKKSKDKQDTADDALRKKYRALQR